MNAVDIKDLSFGYGNSVIFDSLNLCIENGSFCTILGKSGCGKSTLFKLLSGRLNYDGVILILNKSINYNLNKKKLGLVSADFLYFNKNIVIDELRETFIKKGISSEKIESGIKRVSKRFGILKLLSKSIKELSVKEKVLLLLAIQMVNEPKVLILDNILDYLDIEKDIVVKEIHKLNRKKTTIINITNNPEECLFGNEVIILNDGFLKYDINDMDEDDFLDNNLEAPFMISLSSKLKFYNIIQDNYLDMEKLVDDLWQ